MPSLRDVPIQRKLTILMMLASVGTLLLASMFFVGHELATYRDSALHEVTAVARIVGRNSRAAILFDDPETAERTLATLEVEREVELACIFTRDGRVFAEYLREVADRGCDEVAARPDGHYFERGRLLLHLPIMVEPDRVGTLYVRFSLHEVSGNLWRYAAIAAAVLAVSILAAFLLSARLQRLVSAPVARLADLARRVSEDQDYSLRADKHGNDELGALIDSFNEMLHQIGVRDRELERHRHHLEDEVAARTRELAERNVGLQHEVDARRRAESAVRKSERAYRMLTQQASDGIVILDDTGRLLSINDAGCRILGCSPEDAWERDLGDFIAVADHPANPLSLEDLNRGDTALRELRFRQQNGSVVWTETSLKMLDDGRIQGIIRDVTERKRIEEHLQHSRKMEAVGHLAAGIAHEINNPTAFVRSNLGFLSTEWETMLRDLRERPHDPDALQKATELRAVIDESIEGIDRAIAIVRDVKDFAEHGSEERGPADLNEALNRVLRLVGHQLGAEVSVEQRFGEIPPVFCVVEQIQQVFMNLIVNAAQAVGERGRIRLTTAQEGERVVVTVEDNGCGIAPEILDRVFDPFFTTRPVGGGTGLGLSISYGIVHSHGGDIHVESDLGRGSTFRVTLPCDAPRSVNHPTTGRS